MKSWEYATDNNWMSKSWMNRTILAAEGFHGAAKTIESADQFVTGAWNGDPNVFEQAGHNSGDIIGAGLGMAGMAAWAILQRRSALAPKAFKTATGDVFKQFKHGGFKDVSTGKVQLGPRAIPAGAQQGVYARAFAGKNIGRKGFIKSGGFKGVVKDMGMFVVAPIITGIAAGMALGFAGRYLDEVNADFKSRKHMYYDNRYFDTRKYDASSNEQIGMAMNDYSNKMQSIARVYHSRG